MFNYTEYKCSIWSTYIKELKSFSSVKNSFNSCHVISNQLIWFLFLSPGSVSLSLPHSSPPIPQTLMTHLWAPGFVLFCSWNSAYTTEGSWLENMPHLKTHTCTHKNLSNLIPYWLSSFFLILFRTSITELAPFLQHFQSFSFQVNYLQAWQNLILLLQSDPFF